MSEEKKSGRPRVLSSPKKKFTLYLTDEAFKKFNELFAFRVIAGEMATKSNVLCDAVVLLHSKIFKDKKG